MSTLVLNQPLQGGCACGHVRYLLEAAPIITHACHCRHCQRLTGSAFAVNAMIETERLLLTGPGDPEMVPTPSALREGQPVYRCPHCRVALWTGHALLGPGIALILAGTLDEPERLMPEVHCFTATRHPWVSLPPGVPAFAGDYETDAVWSLEARHRLEAALAAG